MTPILPIGQKRIASYDVFESAMKKRFALAGIAKGAWLGAAADISRAQTGEDKVPFSKNFLGYGKKFAFRGKGVPAKPGWSPSALLMNNAAHSGTGYVVSAKSKNDSLAWGLKNTVKWYNKSLKKSLAKA